MKTKRLYYLLLTALATLGVGSLGWRLAGDIENESLSIRNSLSLQQVKSTVLPLTDRNKFKLTAETPERKNARIMSEVSNATADFTSLMKGYNSGGLKGMLSAQMDQFEMEYIQFFKTLGFSDALSAKVFHMLKSKEKFAQDHHKQKLESLARGELHEAHDDKLLQMESDLEATVGAENFDKIKYWEDTRQDRKHAQGYKIELERLAFHLTGEQEASVVDALYQNRQGKVAFGLNMPFVPLGDKLIYIENVKKKLAPVLSGSAVELLGRHLRGVAERPLVPPVLQAFLPKETVSKLLVPPTPQKPPPQIARPH